jgi:hypothetical protein
LFFHDRSIRVQLVLPSLIRMPLFQSQIVRHAKNPTAKISARSSELQVTKKREKYFLSDLLPIMHG